MDAFLRRLVPDELWEVFQRVVPPAPTRPQGGGRRRVGDRAILVAIVHVATTGCAWRQLPPVFGASWQTVNRRFTEWSTARVLAKLYRILLHEHPDHQQIQKTKQHESRVLAPDDLIA